MQPEQLDLSMIAFLDQRMRGSLPNGIDEAGAAQVLQMQQNIRRVFQSQADALQAPKPQAEPASNVQPPTMTAEDYQAAMAKVKTPKV